MFVEFYFLPGRNIKILVRLLDQQPKLECSGHQSNQQPLCDSFPKVLVLTFSKFKLFPVDNFLLKVRNKNKRLISIMPLICLTLTIKP